MRILLLKVKGLNYEYETTDRTVIDLQRNGTPVQDAVHHPVLDDKAAIRTNVWA
jgi:hypothetical protein